MKQNEIVCFRSLTKKQKPWLKAKLTLMVLLVFLMQVSATGQQKSVTGKVIDDSGQSMPGVTVLVKGTSKGTATNVDGNYSITDVPDNAILVFSFVGMKTQELEVNGKSSINVTMQMDAIGLDEVVAIGYGTVKKSDLTSSIATVSSEEVNTMLTNNISEALQGKAAGVQVIQGTKPGEAPQVLIRGVSTFNLDTKPLYIVDGVPNGGDQHINSNDIADIQILKDASAAAIYGSRASNGVILITTKKGKLGKPSVTFSARYGMKHNKQFVDMADAVEYANIYNIATTNSGMSNFYENPSQYEGKTTDWWGAGVKTLSPQRDLGMKVSGGTANTKYFASAYYNDNKSMYKVGNGDQKLNLRFNMQLNLGQYIDGGLSISPMLRKVGYADNYNSYYAIDPITPIFKTDDELTGDEGPYDIYSRSPSGVWNPVAADERYNNFTYSSQIPMIAFINIKPVDGLVLHSKFSYEIYNSRTEEFYPTFVIDKAHEKANESRVVRDYDYNDSYSWINTATFSKTIDKHDFSAMAGFTVDKRKEIWFGTERYNTPTNQEYLQEIDAGLGVATNSGNSLAYSLLSYLGRVTYNYDQKYFLTATFRRDGSSKFLKENKWATFPSASLAWRISEESFMDNSGVLSNLKLRFGWGQVGNQNIPGNVYLSEMGNRTMVSPYGEGVRGTNLESIANPSIKWETVEDINGGVDFGFLNNHIFGSIEYYEKRTKDMLFNRRFPWYSGYPGDHSEVWFNVGNMETKGFDFALGVRNKVGDFSYGAQLNLTTYKVEMTKLPSDAILSGNSRSVVGDEPAYFYGYVSDGIYQNQEELDANTANGVVKQDNARIGDIRYKDISGPDGSPDGVWNGHDKTKIGSPWPKFTSGLNLNAGYKGFDFRAEIYVSYGNDLIHNSRRNLYGNLQSRTNKASGLIGESWHGEGTSTTIPRLYFNDLNNYVFSDLFVQDGSFLSLRNLAVGYTIPDISGIKNARISLSGQNLLLLTNYEGANPEQKGSVSKFGVYAGAQPAAPTYVLGISLTF